MKFYDKVKLHLGICLPYSKFYTKGLLNMSAPFSQIKGHNISNKFIFGILMVKYIVMTSYQ